MRRVRHLSALRAVLAACLVVGSGGPVALPAVAAATSPLEAIEVEREIPAPSGYTWVDAVGAAFFLPDQVHIVATAHDGHGERAVVMALDGSEFRCLTCGLLEKVRAPQAFPDGKRLFLSASLGEGGTSDSQSFVLECQPSLVRCEDRRLVDVTFPIDSLTQPPSAQNREAGIHPSGEYVKWGEVRAMEGQRMTIGRLVRADSEYVVEQPRVMNPAYRLDGTLEDFIAASRFYEAQGYTDGWTDGGRVMKYGATTTAENYDIWELDLTTGERRRLTDDLDYNENGDYSPSGDAIAYANGRGLDRMDVFTALERPPLLDVVGFAQLGRVGLHNNRRCLNERWLMARKEGETRGGYGGQPVVLDDDWASRSWSWSADGTRALLVEDRLQPVNYTSGDVHEHTRMRIVRFPGRRPSPAPSPHRLTDTDLARSTVAYADYAGLPGRGAVGPTTLAGPHSGTATVTYLGTFAGGRFAVAFDRYSADGRTFISGTEVFEVPNPVVASRYTADLTATGETPGRMTANLTIRARDARGEIRTRVGDRTYDGITTQLDCPGIRQPELRLDVLRRRALRGGRVAVTVRVTSRVVEDDRYRPVRGVLVQAARGGRAAIGRRGARLDRRAPRNARARTDERGRATVVLIRRGAAVIGTHTDGFRDAAATVRLGGRR